MPKLSYQQWTSLLGAVLAIAIGAADGWWFGGHFGSNVDLLAIGSGLGVLYGVGGNALAGAGAAAIPKAPVP